MLTTRNIAFRNSVNLYKFNVKSLLLLRDCDVVGLLRNRYNPPNSRGGRQFKAIKAKRLLCAQRVEETVKGGL